MDNYNSPHCNPSYVADYNIYHNKSNFRKHCFSLGMVGALSIVRFRNPVRSPLELTVYFCAITMGIAAGVSLKWLIFLGIAIILALIILIFVSVFSKNFLINFFLHPHFRRKLSKFSRDRI